MQIGTGFHALKKSVLFHFVFKKIINCRRTKTEIDGVFGFQGGNQLFLKP